MSPAFDDLNRHLSVAAQNTPTAPLASAKHTIDRLTTLFADDTHPSGHEHVLGVLDRLRHASTALERTITRAHQTIDAIAALADCVGATPITPRSPPTPQRPDPQPAPALSVTNGRDDVPERVASLARKLPRRTGPQDKTEGFLLARDQILKDPIFTAEPDGRLRSRHLRTGTLPAAGAGLRLPAAKANVMDHVEAQAASILRQPGAPRRATLILNNQPCDDPLHPLTCEKLLQGILKEGTTVTVYVTDGNNTWPHQVYTGTGREIAR